MKRFKVGQRVFHTRYSSAPQFADGGVVVAVKLGQITVSWGVVNSDSAGAAVLTIDPTRKTYIQTYGCRGANPLSHLTMFGQEERKRNEIW